MHSIQSLGNIISIILALFFMIELRLGFLGLIFGFWIGKKIEKLIKDNIQIKQNTSPWPNQVTPHIFALMGHIAKADGKVSKQSITLVEKVMKKYKFSSYEKKQAINSFNQGKQSTVSIDNICKEMQPFLIFAPYDKSKILQLLLHIAHADGPLSAKKTAILQNICYFFGHNFHTRNNSRSRQEYQQQNIHEQSSSMNTTKAHHILGTSPKDTKETITKKYRKLLSKYHPDRLKANKKEFSEKSIKEANEKTFQIKTAYETIKKEKQWN